MYSVKYLLFFILSGNHKYKREMKCNFFVISRRLIYQDICKERVQMRKKLNKEKTKEMRDFYRSILLISLGITMLLIFQVMLM